jgi:hypothetical protein
MMFAIFHRKTGVVAGDYDKSRSEKNPANSAEFEVEGEIVTANDKTGGRTSW